MVAQSGRIVRFTASSPCPVCGGHEDLTRGRGVRCYGFLTPDGSYAHCTRSELAGPLVMDTAQSYGHYLLGPCRCGFDHRGGVLTWQPVAPMFRHRRSVIDDIPVWRDPAWRLAETYVYRDASGKPLYRVQRWERKDGSAKRFLQQRADPQAQHGWRAGLGGINRVPYRLPELIQGNNARRLILIVEGEKCVESLRAHGFLATCNPEGAHKGAWRPELSRWFVGRHVVILPDNDDVGHEHGHEVARALASVAASVRWLALSGVSAKGDVADWLDADGTAAELCRLLRAAPRWITPTLPQRIDLAAPGCASMVVTIPPWIESRGAALW